MSGKFYVLYKDNKVTDVFSENDTQINNVSLMLKDGRIDALKVVDFEGLQKIVSTGGNVVDSILNEMQKQFNDAFPGEKTFDTFFNGMKEFFGEKKS